MKRIALVFKGGHVMRGSLMSWINLSRCLRISVTVVLAITLHLFTMTSYAAAQSDIQACITNQWGNDCPPIKLFGREAVVGEVISVPLREYDEKYALAAFEDPLPVHAACPGYGYYRDADISIVSRITLGQGRVLILIRHAGGRGFHGGSEGYVQIGDDWFIVNVLTDSVVHEYDDCYINIDEYVGRVEWRSRAGCPACACLEGRTYISFIVQRYDNTHNPGCNYTPFISTRTTSFDIEAAVTAEYGHGHKLIKIFGRDAFVGQAVGATLREKEEKYVLAGFEDPLPVYSQCPGYGYWRDANISVISRVTLGQNRVLVLMRHAGGRGYHGGSEGYIQLENGWHISEVLSDALSSEFGGTYVRIDKENGTLEWRNRAGCPDCACLEGRGYISFVAELSPVNKPPIAICKDIEISADENCQAIIVADDVDGGSYDPDEGDNITLSVDNIGPFSLGEHIVNLTVTDEYDESDTCQAKVTVVDITPPEPDEFPLPDVIGECGVEITSPPTAFDSCSGVVIGSTNDPIEYAEQGHYTITWSYTDESGNTTDQTQNVIVEDVTAPVPSVGILPTVTGQCSAEIKEVPMAIDNCSKAIEGITSDPLIYTEQGTYTVNWTYDDGNGNISVQTQTVVVEDTIAPNVNAFTVSPNVLWPPNHKMVLITPTMIASDNCDPNPVIELISITTNEGDETNTYDPNYDSNAGDGNTINDIHVDEEGNIYLRAERMGPGTGRIYTITYAVTDASGNSTTVSVTVTVPHDER